MKGARLFALVIVGLLLMTSGALVASVAIGSTQRNHEISFIANRTNGQGWLWTELTLLDVDTLTTTRIAQTGGDMTWRPDGSFLISLMSSSWMTDREDELFLYDVFRGFRTAETFKVDDLPSDPAVTLSSAWSPDGLHLAFTVDTFNTYHELYVYTPATGASQNLTQTPEMSEEVFVWSPDSQSIAYTNTKAELWVVTLGEVPRKLPLTLADPTRKPLWWLDSASLIVKTPDDTTAGTQISVSDGTRTVLPFCNLLDDTKYLSKLAWHPDGRLTCTVRNKKIRITDIVLVDLAINRSAVIGQEQAVVDNLAWSSDGLYLLYQADSTSLGFNVMAYDAVSQRLTRVIRLEGSKAVWRPAQ